MKEGF